MAGYAAKDETRRAALIHFRDDITHEQAQRVLRRIALELDAPYSGDVGDYVRTYNPNEGGPVWYIP